MKQQLPYVEVQDSPPLILIGCPDFTLLIQRERWNEDERFPATAVSIDKNWQHPRILVRCCEN